ncbi:MAG: choice-of-anchor J domain-containing protein [Deltaproteobacteria bacterium]|nr:choice-of-anchor J domain-containing protein [Deltaproteobacteria bacterium]
MKRFSWVLSLLSLLALPLAVGGLAGCPTTDDDDATTPEPEPCQRPTQREDPVLVVQGPEEAQTAGFPVEIVAAAGDDDGIALVTLYYRTQGATAFFPAQMTDTEVPVEIDGDPGTLFTAQIPGNYVVAPGVEYYVVARDAGPCADETTRPEDAPEPDVYQFDTIVVTTSIPLYSDFEDGTCESDEDLVGGWNTISQQFPDPGHSWRNDLRSPRSGSCSISHSEGAPGLWDCPPPEDDGNVERLNWLVSPALDFSTKTAVALRWFEREQESGSCAELHSVYVSTGLPDPGDPTAKDGGTGEYELVVDDLPKPGEDWQASQWVDLSAFAGAETAYVALVYRGGAAGRWQIDDIYVGEPLADLELNEEPILDPSVEPGTTGVELNLVLRNTSELYGAPELSALLETDDPNLTLTSATTTFPPIGVGATGNAATAFVFDVDAAHADNAYLDFTLRLDDGNGHLWALPIRMLMGEESFTTVMSTPSDMPLQLSVGHGPLGLPNFVEGTTTDAVGGNPWSLNVTEEAAALPPGPGPMRWFFTANNTGLQPATIDSWDFEVGGVALLPEGLPATVPPGEQIVLYYPSPPSLAVAELSTTPDPAAPDGSVTIDTLTLTNSGASTVAGLNCILSSSDPNASGFSTDILTFGGTPLGAGETRAMDQAATFDIAAAHTDDEPIELVLLCSDGFDSLPVVFEIEVPYGRPQIDSVLIDDSISACSGCSGDSDGYADPSETALVFLTAINDGSLPLSAPLEATVTASTSSPVPFTLVNGNNIPFGSSLLAPGETATATAGFELGVDPASLIGDRMVFDVTWTAGTDTWTSEFTIDVTGIPWLACNFPDDAEGDVIAGTGALDIKSCEYRSDNVMLQLRLNSWNDFDPTTQPLWFLFYEAPSLYSVEFVPPATPVLEDGCLTGNDIFPTQLPLSVDNQLTTSASVRIGLDDLNELGNSLQVAFAAGFCMGFCDVYPNNSAFWPSGGAPTCTQAQFVQINW